MHLIALFCKKHYLQQYDDNILTEVA